MFRACSRTIKKYLHTLTTYEGFCSLLGKKKKKRFIFSFKGFSKGQQAVGCGRRCIYGIIKKKKGICSCPGSFALKGVSTHHPGDFVFIYQPHFGPIRVYHVICSREIKTE